MNDNIEKRTEAIFDSMKDSQRAKPSPELYARIQNQLFKTSAKVISLKQWKRYAAVACLLLAINTIALFNYRSQEVNSNEVIVSADHYQESLITSYQIYE